jgi:hypothetical protein
MGFVSKVAALAFAATVSVASAVSIDDYTTKLTEDLTQADTNGTSCLLPTDCFVR